MPKLEWDLTGEHFYETGVRNGVLYPYVKGQTEQTSGYLAGVAWNGLTAVTESPSGADETPLYADDIKYLSLRAAEEFGGTIEAYTYPDEWMECDGSASIATGVVIGQQNRKMFGLCYRTTLGNDTELNDHGYKLHLVYGCTASPSERAYQTINDSPEAITFSWEFSTTPVKVKIDDVEFKPTSVLTVDSTKVDSEKLQDLLDVLYGTDDVPGEGGAAGTEGTTARLPLPDEVVSLLS